MTDRYKKYINSILFLTAIVLQGASSCMADAAQPLAKDQQLVCDGVEDIGSGYFLCSDPDLAKIGDTWFMFFTSIEATSQKLFILAATLPAGKGLDADVSEWKIMRFPDGRPIPIIAPTPGSWDADAVETAKFVRGYDPSTNTWVHRIYYTGWKKSGNSKDYRIGFAEWNGQVYAKHGAPVLKGEHPWEKYNGKSLVGDQSVIYLPGPGADGAGGTWHMYYQANSSEPSPAVRTIHAISSDGVSWPKEQRRLLDTRPPFPDSVTPAGPYYIDVQYAGNQFLFSGWIPSKQDLSKQGIWLTRSSTPDGIAPGDFSNWQPLVFDRNGTWWHKPLSEDNSRKHEMGIFGTTLEQDQGRYWLFYHGVTADGGSRRARIGRAEVDLEI